MFIIIFVYILYLKYNINYNLYITLNKNLINKYNFYIFNKLLYNNRFIIINKLFKNYIFILLIKINKNNININNINIIF